MHDIDLADIERRFLAGSLQHKEFENARREVEAAQTPEERALLKEKWFFVLYGGGPNMFGRFMRRT